MPAPSPDRGQSFNSALYRPSQPCSTLLNLRPALPPPLLGQRGLGCALRIPCRLAPTAPLLVDSRRLRLGRGCRAGAGASGRCVGGDSADLVAPGVACERLHGRSMRSRGTTGHAISKAARGVGAYSRQVTLFRCKCTLQRALEPWSRESRCFCSGGGAPARGQRSHRDAVQQK
jgi:hypothetical protein